MIETKLYKGWEIAKLLTEKKLVDGTRIQQYIDKEACDYEGEYEVKDGELFTLIDGKIGDEVGSSVLISEGFEFEVLEKEKNFVFCRELGYSRQVILETDNSYEVLKHLMSFNCILDSCHRLYYKGKNISQALQIIKHERSRLYSNITLYFSVESILEQYIHYIDNLE